MPHGVTGLRFRIARSALVDKDNFPTGGNVIQCKATVALNTGDNVYLDATTDQVTKSATAANYANKYLGVVVGGDSFQGGQVASRSNDVGFAACGAGGQVLVQIDGVAYTTADGAMTIGNPVIGGTTSGRVASGSTATQVFGNALDTGSASAVIRMLIRPR